jgi:hypothetical protein
MDPAAVDGPGRDVERVMSSDARPVRDRAWTDQLIDLSGRNGLPRSLRPEGLANTLIGVDQDGYH